MALAVVLVFVTALVIPARTALALASSSSKVAATSNVTASTSSSASTATSTVPTVRVGIYPYPGYAEKDANGVWVGYDIELTEAIAQKIGRRVEFVPIDSYQGFLDALSTGAIDVADSMARTTEREQSYLFGEYANGATGSSLLVRDDEADISYGNVDQIASLRIGAVEGVPAQYFSEWCATRGISPTVVSCESSSDAFAALDAGDVDAIAIGVPAQSGYRTVLSYGTVPYYYMYSKSNAALKAQFDSAMGELLYYDPLYENTLVEKYGLNDLGSSSALSTAEKSYVAEHPSLVVAVVSNDAPYFELASDGSPTGVIPGFFNQMGEALGVTFTYRAYETQDEATAAVLSGDADVLGIYSDGLPYAAAAGLSVTDPYTTMNAAMITRAGQETDSIRTIAVKVRSRGALETMLTTKFPGASLVSYSTASECFDALQSGAVDAMVIGQVSATYLVNQNNPAGYSVTSLSSKTLEVCAAVVMGNSVLNSLLDRGIALSSSSVDGIISDSTATKATFETTVARIPAPLVVGFSAFLVTLVVALVLALVKLSRDARARAKVMLAKTQAEEKERSAEEKNAFFSNLSHDMRTPLNAIMGFIRLAGKEGITAEQRADYLAKAELSSGLMLDLINDTLVISRANSGKLELNLAPVSTLELLEAVTSPIEETAHDKGVEFVVDASALPNRTIMADKLGIQKIFLNLLSNALKFTPTGGHIWFTAAQRPVLREGTLDYLLVVRDDGIGMTPAFVPHVFEPFSQEYRTAASDAPGTGLGLSIVKRYVDLMGGSIEVESEPGKGTTFTVRLRFDESTAPDATLATDAAGADVGEGDVTAQEAGEDACSGAVAGATSADDSSRGARSSATDGLAGVHVLLCEDNMLNREIATALLEDRGVVVTAAVNGRDGVDAFGESEPGHFSAILMDVRMPQMDGFEATYAIRALDRPDATTIPIIAMTANAFEDDVRACLDAGMDAHIAKPIDPERLYGELARLVGRSRGGQSAAGGQGDDEQRSDGRGMHRHPHR